MGKHKPVNTLATKAGVTATNDKERKDIKKDLTHLGHDAEDKSDAPKDGGVKPAKKAHKSEIDDIFSMGKQKALEGKRVTVESAGQEADGAAAKAAAPSKRPRVEGSKDDIFGEATTKGRKRTDEGYAIYTEEELGLGKKGGETDLCPFDCDCCF